MEIVKKAIKKAPKPEFPKPSIRLSAKSRRLRERVLREWALTDAAVILLDETLSWRDEAAKYKAILEKEGISIENPRTQASRPNPAMQIVKNARANFLAGWRLLDLREDSKKNRPGRPPATYPTEVD